MFKRDYAQHTVTYFGDCLLACHYLSKAERAFSSDLYFIKIICHGHENSSVLNTYNIVLSLCWLLLPTLSSFFQVLLGIFLSLLKVDKAIYLAIQMHDYVVRFIFLRFACFSWQNRSANHLLGRNQTVANHWTGWHQLTSHLPFIHNFFYIETTLQYGNNPFESKVIVQCG